MSAISERPGEPHELERRDAVDGPAGGVAGDFELLAHTVCMVSGCELLADADEPVEERCQHAVVEGRLELLFQSLGCRAERLHHGK